MSVDLKPCPFCGGEAALTNYVIEAAVKCARCPATITVAHGPYDDTGVEGAVDAWNTRTASVSPTPGKE